MIDLTAARALIFRITHIDNLVWILSHGLHCGNSDTSDPNFVQIGSAELILKRGHRVVPAAPGGSLDDYVPFYFTPLSPMLLNIKTGRNGVTQRPMRDIVVLVSSLHALVEQNLPFLFSDRHAYLEAAQFSSDLSDLGRLDWERLRATDFRRDPNDLAKFERYQAEALVHRHLPAQALRAIVCLGTAEEARLRDLVQDQDIATQIVARPGWFF